MNQRLIRLMNRSVILRNLIRKILMQKEKWKRKQEPITGHLQENFMMSVRDESVMMSSLIFGNAKKN